MGWVEGRDDDLGDCSPRHENVFFCIVLSTAQRRSNNEKVSGLEDKVEKQKAELVQSSTLRLALTSAPLSVSRRN